MDDGVKYDRIVCMSNLQTGESTNDGLGVTVKGHLEQPLTFGAIQ